MTLGCLVKDYFPDPLTITWHTDTSEMSTVNFPAQTLSSELKVTTSIMTTSSSDKQNFTCHVAHVPSSGYMNVTVPGEQGWAGLAEVTVRKNMFRAGRAQTHLGQKSRGHPARLGAWAEV